MTCVDAYCENVFPYVFASVVRSYILICNVIFIRTDKQSDEPYLDSVGTDVFFVLVHRFRTRHSQHARRYFPSAIHAVIVIKVAVYCGFYSLIRVAIIICLKVGVFENFTRRAGICVVPVNFIERVSNILVEFASGILKTLRAVNYYTAVRRQNFDSLRSGMVEIIVVGGDSAYRTYKTLRVDGGVFGGFRPVNGYSSDLRSDTFVAAFISYPTRNKEFRFLL